MPDTAEAKFAVDTLCKAYFFAANDEPMAALANEFIAVRIKLTPSSRVFVKDDPARIVVKLLMCFLRSMLVTEYNRLGHDNHQLTTNVVCENSTINKFADAISDSGQYIRWTHIILSIIGSLRIKCLPVADGAEIKKEVIPIDKMQVKEVDALMHVYDNARLLFYALLLNRLSSVMFLRYASAKERFDLEVCLFMTIIFFYSDYVQIQKDPPKSIAKDTLANWKRLFLQVDLMYLPSNGPFFTMLKLGEAGGTVVARLKSFLSQDTIGQARDCLTAAFLHKYRKNIMDLNQISFDLTPVRSCLNNMQSSRMRLSRWFRNTIVQNIRSAGVQISDAAGKLYRIVNFAALFARDYPIVTALGTVAIALAAYNKEIVAQSFANSLLSAASQAISYVQQNVSPYTFLKIAAGTALLEEGVKTAWVFVYTDPDLQKEPENIREKIKNETVQADRAPYLELVTSPEGDINTIYRVAPLAPLSRWWDFTKKKQQSNPQGWTMPSPAVGGSGGIPLSRDVQQMKEAFDRGYLRDELPEEMQRYIRKRTNIHVGTRRGGAASKNWEEIKTKDYGQYGADIPSEFKRERYVGEGSAADVAQTTIDGATLKTWIPNVEIETDMLNDPHTGFAIDIADPADELDTPSDPIMTRQDLIRVAKNKGISLPPVLPPTEVGSTTQVSTLSSAAYFPDYARRRASYGRFRSRSRSRGPMRRRSGRKQRKPLKKTSRSRPGPGPGSTGGPVRLVQASQGTRKHDARSAQDLVSAMEQRVATNVPCLSITTLVDSKVDWWSSVYR